MADGGVDIRGLREVRDLLRRLPASLERRAYRTAARNALKPVQDRAKALAPVKSGTLRKSIKIRTEKFRTRGGVRAQVWVDPGRKGRPGAHYAHMVEYGTAAHQVPTPYGVLHGRKVFIPGVGYRTRIDHPGSRARPFLRPAWDGTQGEVLTRLRFELRKALEAQVRSMRRRVG